MTREEIVAALGRREGRSARLRLRDTFDPVDFVVVEISRSGEHVLVVHENRWGWLGLVLPWTWCPLMRLEIDRIEEVTA